MIGIPFCGSMSTADGENDCLLFEQIFHFHILESDDPKKKVTKLPFISACDGLHLLTASLRHSSALQTACPALGTSSAAVRLCSGIESSQIFHIHRRYGA